MIAKAFGPSSIDISTEKLSWLEALERSVNLLVESGRTKPEYFEQVLASTQKLGPYFVVAPGIAIAHAAPSSAVLETGFALLKLEKPVASGSINDPVSLLFSFASVDSESHIELLGEFANMMSTPGKVNLLLNASAIGEIRDILSENLVG
ncbi:MAG: PTS sugar transporter subunit IIA [Aquiluna sp.]|nr:PTS sugar transporter subunit IIA [Aquiluna sp.]MCF8546248.1 PTS sugar transporter subunit IIA [Aquiluna sp.]